MKNHSCIDHVDIQNMDGRYRNNFINSLSGYKSANLIGTENNGLANLALFSSAVHVGANPPLMGLVSRPNTVPRHTLENIEATGFYTINSVSKTFIKQAHHCSARSDRDHSEFDFSGLNYQRLDGFSAPFVKESNLKLAMKLDDVLHIKRNGTVFIVGEIMSAYLPQEAIYDDGFIDHEKLSTVCISGLDSYHTVGHSERFEYAKNTKAPSSKFS